MQIKCGKKHSEGHQLYYTAAPLQFRGLFNTLVSDHHLSIKRGEPGEPGDHGGPTVAGEPGGTLRHRAGNTEAALPS